MRNLKTMGLALVAIFAMSAMGAAAAQAEPAHFGAGAGTDQIDVEAESSQDFSFPGQVVTCETLDGHAAYPTIDIIEEEEVETPEVLTATDVGFTDCDTVILGFIHFDTTVFPEEGCHFTFTAGTWTGEDAEGSVHICEVTINQYKDEDHKELYCQEHVPAQTVGGLTYTNAERNETAAVTVDVNSEVTTTITDLNNIGCNEHKHLNATYEGTFWAYGTNKADEPTDTSVTG